jgi:hypothetical protein
MTQPLHSLLEGWAPLGFSPREEELAKFQMEARKCAQKLTFKLFETISADTPRIFRR